MHDETTIDLPEHAKRPASSGACVVAIAGPVRGVFELPAGAEIAIGRSRSSEIQVDDKAVSRLHATLAWDGKSRVRVTDHGSRNGTYVGGRRVSGEAHARHDDVVRVGPASFVVLVSRALPETKSTPEGAMRRALVLAERAARCDLNVLVLGETGVGKEVLARRIHEASARASGPFVAVHCGAIPETLAESVLFGHEKGAFTGADARREGVLEAADRGTVFLDEIGELRPGNQVRLLRALEERAVTRVGGTKPVPVEIRVIAATHRDLDRAVAEGTFRRDLLYRLDVLRIEVPPLRERLDELPELTRAILAEIAPDTTIDASGMRELSRHSFPGNVRELRNVLSRAAALGDVRVLDAAAIDAVLPEAGTTPSGGVLRGRVGDVERKAIEEALAATGGNQTHAAARLGISRRALLYKLARYGLKRQR
jgi:transcriptional regulator with PAS, ATPase and Fis domain